MYMMVYNEVNLNTLNKAEHLGYFSASMRNFNDSEIDQLRHFMRRHGVHMQKSNTDPADDWWFFLLPQGSTKARKAHQGDVPRYTVRLPDGYSFTLEQAPLNRDGFFPTPPLVFLDEKKGKSQ
jgi:hypothetical protein